jgi:hypothetical protein
VPALLFGTNSTLSELNLKGYGVLFFLAITLLFESFSSDNSEALSSHNQCQHICIPERHHLIVTQQGQLRCTDYRKALLQITLRLAHQTDILEDVMELLLTLCEMMGIFNADEDKTSPKQVLRLYNLSFSHALAVCSVIMPAKTMTTKSCRQSPFIRSLTILPSSIG